MNKVAAYFGTEADLDDALDTLYEDDAFDDDRVTIIRQEDIVQLKGAIDVGQGEATIVVSPPETWEASTPDVVGRLRREGIKEPVAEFFARHLHDDHGAVVILNVHNKDEAARARKILKESSARLYSDN